MIYAGAVTIGLVVGLATGLVAERVPARPLVQSAGAALIGTFLASVVAAALWLLWPPVDAETLAVSLGLAEALITSVVVILLAAAVHALLESVGVTTHRAVIAGVLGALCGAIGSLSGVGFVHGVR